MRSVPSILAAISLLAFSGSASAVLIQGSIAFSNALGADWTPVESDLSTGTTTALADGIIFNDGQDASLNDDAQVTNAFDDYSAVTLGTLVDFENFVFDVFSGPQLLWSFTEDGDAYSFTMDSLTIGEQDDKTISLTGLGTASITGLEDTKGTWSLTLNQDAQAFSWSSSAAAVPEPSLLALLGIGLLGVGAARRLNKTA